MALVAVQRSPSNSNSSSTISVSDNDVDEDEPDLIMKRVCECFFAIKGAALILPHSTDPRPIKKHPVVGELQQHLQSIFFLLRSQDTITLAVRLESIYDSHIRYMVLVSTLGVNDTEETIILGVDIRNVQCSVGLVLPIWRDTDISMDGDGGFGVHTSSRAYIFKPVSIQAMWSAIQCLNKTCQIARNRNYIPAGLNLTWSGYYSSLNLSSPKCVYEWNLLPDTYSHIQEHMTYHEGFVDGGHYCPSERELTERYIWVKLREIMLHVDLDNVTGRQLRQQLEEEMGRDLEEYKCAIDKQAMTILGQMDSASKILDFLYLGSEWNASNYDEMNKLGIRYVLNVSLEIDNFFPRDFTYHNVRVHDDLQADLLRHWDETYRYLSKAKETGTKALVHCKMGISRSAATVIAFVMKEMGWPLERAFTFVKERRSIAQPNPAFMLQLQEYQGILDASKQRHNALWRSKSESSLSNCGSMENLCNPTSEVFSSNEDLPASLRRRSWSPDEKTANALLDFPEHTETSYVGEVFLRNPSPTGDRGCLADEESSSEDDCSEIHIPVPNLPQSPRNMDTTPGLTPGTSSSFPEMLPDPLMGCKKQESETSKGMDKDGRPTAVVGDSETVQSPEISADEGKTPAENPKESENPLNTNNNSATCLELLRREGVVPEGQEEEESMSVDVRERISTIESQISRLDSSGSPEKTRPDSPLLEELTANTVRRTKEKLEQRMKGDLPNTTESEDDDLVAMGGLETDPDVSEVFHGMESEGLTQKRDQAHEEEMDTSVEVHPKDSVLHHQMDTSSIHHKGATKDESCPGQEQGPSGPVPPQYSSPSLSNVEPGSVLRSREKFQSWQIKGWKSPNYDDDSMAKFESVKIDSKAVEYPQSPEAGLERPEEARNVRFSGGEQNTLESLTGDMEVGSVTDGHADCTVSPDHSDPVDQATERHIPTCVHIEQDSSEGGDVVPDSGTESFITIPSGEEIPLQPGTVKRQTEGFEQLNMDASERLKESPGTGDCQSPLDVGVVMEQRGFPREAIDAKNMEHGEGQMHDEFGGPCIEGNEDSPNRNEDDSRMEEEANKEGHGIVVSEAITEDITSSVCSVGASPNLGNEGATSDIKNSETTVEVESDNHALTIGEVHSSDYAVTIVETSGEMDDIGKDECTVMARDGDYGGSTDEGVWKVGDVKRHTQELEKLASPVCVSVQAKPVTSPKASNDQEPTLSSEKLQEIRDLGRAILGHDDEDSVKGERPDDTEGTRPSSFPSFAGDDIPQEDADCHDFVGVLERVRHLELKRCKSIASMSSEKVSRKYRNRRSKDSTQGSPEKELPTADRGPQTALMSDGTDSVLRGMETDGNASEGSNPSIPASKTIIIDLVAGDKDRAVVLEESGSDKTPSRNRTESLEKDRGSAENNSCEQKEPVFAETGKTSVFRVKTLSDQASPTSGLPNPSLRSRPTSGEKKPYGPTHPLARLRQSSGKHPFYSTM